MKEILLKAKGIEAVSMGDELAMLNIESGQYVMLNDVGKVIWEKIDGTNTIEDIIQQLLKEYDVDETVCREEATEFIQLLLEEKIIEKS